MVASLVYTYLEKSSIDWGKVLTRQRVINGLDPLIARPEGGPSSDMQRCEG
jgi:hypothetical protein